MSGYLRRTALAMLAAIALAVGGVASVGAQPAQAATTFRDVPPSHPFYTDISWLADRGITSGYPDGTFHPSESVTRAAYAVFLYRMSGKPAYTPPAASPFRDVPTSHQFYREIAWLASVKVTTGWDVGGGKKEFRPEQKITRDAMAAFMYRYACSPNFVPPAASPFRDVPASHQFYREISWMKATGLSTGWSDGTYRPTANTERAAIAAFLHRYSDRGFSSVPECRPSTLTPVVPAAVTFSDNNGMSNDTFTVPSTKGVIYKIGGTALSAGMYKVASYASYGSSYRADLSVSAEPAAGYRIDGTSQWTRTFDGIETIAAPQPTFKDVTGGSSKDTVVIPNTPGVTYKVNGKAVNAGTLSVGQFVSYPDGSANKVKLEVTATEKPGYKISGTRNWTGHYDGLTIVTAAAPVFNDRNGQIEDTFTIPSRKGVTYFVSGSKQSRTTGAGTYKVPDYAAYTNYQAALTVEAKVETGYRLEGDSTKWATLFDGNTNVTPAAPAFDDKNGMTNDTVTIPNAAGVTYYVGSRALEAGSYSAADLAPYKNYSTQVKIEARPKAGYRLDGTTDWTKTFSGITTTTATAVTFADENGIDNDTFTVPTRTGVTYYAGETALKKGTYKVSDYFTYTKYKAPATITAQANAGYALSGTTQWTQTIDGITTVTPAAVTFADKNGTASDTFTVPAVTGVQYVAGGKNVGTGTFKVADYFTYEGEAYKAAAKVTATAKSGYALDGTKAWSKSISGITTVTPAAVSFTDENGMAKDTVTIPESTGVDYYAGTKLLKAGTHKISSAFDYGTAYSVEAVITAKPQATYALKGTTEWRQVMDGITTTTAKAVTFKDANGMDSDTFTVPNVTGVQYVAGGKNVAAGTYKVADYFDYGSAYSVTAKVTAQAKAGYKLADGSTAAWSKKLSGITTVATEPVTFKDANGMASDTFTVPDVTGVQYKAGDKELAPGTYKVKDYFPFVDYKTTATVTAVAKPGYKLTGDTSWTQAFDGITTVTPKDVTFSKDENGEASDTFTVPSTTGVQYKAGTKNVAAGTYKVGDYFTYSGSGDAYAATAKVSAVAKAGYKIADGASAAWSQQFSGITTVTTKAPTFTDKNGKASDVLVIPEVEGVQYKVNGKDIAAGTYKINALAQDETQDVAWTNHKAPVTVTAAAKAKYKLSDASKTEWSTTYDGIASVATKDVTFSADADGMDNDTFTIPSVTGVQYKVNGANIAAGTYKVADKVSYGSSYSAKVDVTAVAKSGYRIDSGKTSWSATFDGWKRVTPGKVTFTDKNGYANDTVVIPSTAGVQYKVGGKVATAGIHKLSEFYDFPAANYEIVAQADASALEGYKLTGTTSWTQVIDGLTHVNTTAPTFTDEQFQDKDTIVIPKVTGVQYELNGANIAAGTYKAADKISYVGGKAQADVTATGNNGYKIDNEKSWSFTFTSVVPVTAKAPTFNDVDGRDGDSIVIPNVEGVQYSIAGKKVNPGTYRVSAYATYAAGKATVKVTAAAASASYQLNGTTQWSQTFTAKAVQKAPTFDDANRTVTIPDNEGVYYTLDGVRVNPGTYSISGFENNQQRAVVHAYVADDAYENALGKAIWEHTYSESSLPTPQKRSTRTNDYGTKTASQASQILSQYASNLNVAISDSSTYAQYTTIGQVLGLDGKSVYQGTGALDSWTNPHRELSWRFAARYQQRLSEVRAAIGLNPIQLMRLTDSQEQALRSHAIYTQSIQGNGSYSAVGGSPTLWGVFEGTRTSGSGYAWDGTDVWQVPEAVSSGFHVARNYQTKVTPEQLADAAIVDLLSDAGTLTNRTPSTRLSYMLSDKQIAHYPSLHIHSMREGSDAATNSTFGFIVTDDFSWKQH